MEVALKLVINVTDNGAETGLNNKRSQVKHAVHCTKNAHANKKPG